MQANLSVAVSLQFEPCQKWANSVIKKDIEYAAKIFLLKNPPADTVLGEFSVLVASLKRVVVLVLLLLERVPKSGQPTVVVPVRVILVAARFFWCKI